MSLFHAVLGLVVLQRLAELVLAARNTSRLRAAGAIELDARGYPAFIVLHGGWLLSLALFVPATAAVSWPLLAVYAALQLGRVWVIASLGRHWTTRLIVLPGAPLVRRGPYRWLHHPNYTAVVAEVVALPLVHSAWLTAIAFTIANALVLNVRIRTENRALGYA